MPRKDRLAKFIALLDPATGQLFIPIMMMMLATGELGFRIAATGSNLASDEEPVTQDEAVVANWLRSGRRVRCVPENDPMGKPNSYAVGGRRKLILICDLI